ncbi:MAG: hypothetical protein L6247_03270 [Desulfobacteraceae bacterium]|nr:hypothetical protein [Pseudomonadota bacterium]MBU4462766.1 hypothetical protein [Pseudomonadota bacterium]MCG2754581.1 hypothetical protein [Desulfobacteraceae bacterium]
MARVCRRLEGSKFFLIGDEYELAKLVEEWLHENHPKEFPLIYGNV